MSKAIVAVKIQAAAHLRSCRTKVTAASIYATRFQRYYGMYSLLMSCTNDLMLSYEADPGRTRHAAAATVFQIQAWVRSLICRKELSKLTA